MSNNLIVAVHAHAPFAYTTLAVVDYLCCSYIFSLLLKYTCAQKSATQQRGHHKFPEVSASLTDQMHRGKTR